MKFKRTILLSLVAVSAIASATSLDIKSYKCPDGYSPYVISQKYNGGYSVYFETPRTSVKVDIARTLEKRFSREEKSKVPNLVCVNDAKYIYAEAATRAVANGFAGASLSVNNNSNDTASSAQAVTNYYIERAKHPNTNGLDNLGKLTSNVYSSGNETARIKRLINKDAYSSMRDILTSITPKKINLAFKSLYETSPKLAVESQSQYFKGTFPKTYKQMQDNLAKADFSENDSQIVNENIQILGKLYV